MGKDSNVSLFQRKGPAGSLALEHVELEVFSGHDAVRTQYHFHRLAGQLGMVVLFAEVA